MPVTMFYVAPVSDQLFALLQTRSVYEWSRSFYEHCASSLA